MKLHPSNEWQLKVPHDTPPPESIPVEEHEEFVERERHAISTVLDEAWMDTHRSPHLAEEVLPKWT